MAEFEIVMTGADGNSGAVRAVNKKDHRFPVCMPFSVRIGGVAFPHSEWDDFAIVVLNSWLENIAEIEVQGSGKACLRFMDGPFQIEVERLDSKTCRLMGVQRSVHGKNVECMAQVPLNDLRATLIQAAKRTLKMARGGSILENDCSKLAQSVKRMSG
jgi:hypothetical protein